LAVTFGCLAYAFWGLNFGQIRQAFRQANFFTLPLMFAALAGFFWLKAIRWRLLLTPLRRFRTREVFPALMIGFMGNNLLPAHLGEFVRIYVLGRDYRLSKTAIFSSVVLERVLDVIAILLLLGISLLTVRGLPQEFARASLWIAGVTVCGSVALVCYLIWTDRVVRIAEAVLRRVPLLPARLANKLVEMLRAGAEGLHAIRSPKLLWSIAATSVIHWSLNGAMVLIALWSFGQKVPPLASFFVVGVIAFGVTVPSSPGFFGVIQLCFWLAVEPFGVPKAAALAASIYYHLCQYVPVTLVGLYYLNRAGLKLGQVESAAEDTANGEMPGTGGQTEFPP
jgi:glycosyltransferase 2 family protein